LRRESDLTMFEPFADQLIDHLSSGCSDDAERAQTRDCFDFLESDPLCFERQNLARHFTGSSVVLDTETHTHMLMTFHTKAKAWLHLGGHCDGLPHPFVTACVETLEESGLRSAVPVHGKIFDVDVHKVDRHLDVPEHRHYDIRYLFHASQKEPLRITPESKDLKWVPIREVLTYNSNPIVAKLVAKLSFLI
jgi:8-oxo-dGTP pyrophosphatase MutT (NUDIX family)